MRKTTCYLRLSTTLVKGLVEELNKKYAENFSFLSVDGGYTQIMPRSMQGKSSEQIIKELTTLNNFCKRLMPSFRCCIQGSVIIKEEQKMIICNNKKITCYDFTDVSRAIIEFNSSFGYYDRQIVGTTEMLNFSSDFLDELYIYKCLQKGRNLDCIKSFIKNSEIPENLF